MECLCHRKSAIFFHFKAKRFDCVWMERKKIGMSNLKSIRCAHSELVWVMEEQIDSDGFGGGEGEEGKGKGTEMEVEVKEEAWIKKKFVVYISGRHGRKNKNKRKAF